MHRKLSVVVPAAVLALTAALLPAGPAGAAAAPLAGFQLVKAYAQGQAGTGYFFAVGDEMNRLVGARSEINGPPSASNNVAGLVQPGVAASYTYGTAGGGGPGQNGALPQPMPGLAEAFFPADPREAKVEGPLTLGASGKAVDGRFYAKASDTPTGLAEAAVTDFDAQAFAVQDVDVVSHTEPTDGGVLAESTTIMRGLAIGPLRVESLVSHARGLVASAGAAPAGVARTVIHGATVDGVGVVITDRGIVAAESNTPGAQEQINAALRSAGLADVRLTSSVVSVSEDKYSVTAVAGALQVLYQDPALAPQNPQGFSGGGFAVGGADVAVLGRSGS